jgi:hypothetical protein
MTTKNIHAYNAKVTDVLGTEVLGKEPWQNVFYGIELEYEVDKTSEFVKRHTKNLSEGRIATLFMPDGNRQTPISYLAANSVQPYVADFCIIKRDGSLANGMEIVSRPMSLDLHATKWDKFFEIYKDTGLKVARSCGMHVHASRECLTSLQIGKILSFIHNPANNEFLKIIAGRCPPKKYSNITKKLGISDVRRHNERYDGFNLRNGATIEFRIFKGVDTKERMLVNVEFCAAMIGFCHPSTTGIQNCNLEGFINFLKDPKNGKRYPHLCKFLKKKFLK